MVVLQEVLGCPVDHAAFLSGHHRRDVCSEIQERLDNRGRDNRMEPRQVFVKGAVEITLRLLIWHMRQVET